MDKDMIVIFIGVFCIIGLLFGSLMYSQHMKNQCVALMKDRSAIEIRLVCK